MKKDIKTKWLKALRSGDYTKGKLKLRQTDNFCCLGVLCELAVEEGVIQPPIKEVPNNIYYYEGHYGHAPAPVRKWAGLSITSQNKLMELNDSNDTFKEVIRKISKDL